MIGVRRWEQSLHEGHHAATWVVLLKAEGFVWPHRPPMFVGSHSPRSVGCIVNRHCAGPPGTCPAMSSVGGRLIGRAPPYRVAPRGELAGPGGMKMLHAASMELTTVSMSFDRERIT